MQELKLLISSFTRLSSISGRRPLSSSGCSIKASKNSCRAIRVPNHLKRERCFQPCPRLDRRVLKLRESTSKTPLKRLVVPDHPNTTSWGRVL